jgi:hypothetical protein
VQSPSRETIKWKPNERLLREGLACVVQRFLSAYVRLILTNQRLVIIPIFPKWVPPFATKAELDLRSLLSVERGPLLSRLRGVNASLKGTHP